MPGQLFNQAFGDIFPSSQSVVIPSLLISTFYLAFKPSDTDRNPPNAKILKAEYDFIIVGAGSAGAVVANRLSENSDFQVLVLEAGGDETAITDTPGFQYRFVGTKQDWNYTTESSSKFCLAKENGTCIYPRGRILGGCSAINGMTYVRGNKRNYDEWAEGGNYGWSYEEVLTYFKKSEDNTNSTIAENKRYHSINGELTISDQRWKTPLTEIFLKAGEEMGYYIGDYNAENQTVFGYEQFTMRDGYRCSTNKAFLVPAGKRSNLDVSKHSHVTKVLIDPATNRAYGVRFLRNGVYSDVVARKEVILSAGVFNTPQLLMLSGIGPKEHLKDLNIPLIKDLQVGFNLQDHVGVVMPFFTDKSETYDSDQYNSLLVNMTFELFQKGPLTATGYNAAAFLNSKFNYVEKSPPDLKFFLSPLIPETPEDSFSEEATTTKSPPHVNKGLFSVFILMIRPESRGRLLLRSNNPFEKPMLKMNYFDKEIDLKRLVDGGRIVLDLMETKAFKSINARYQYSPIPLCPNALPPSEEYLECYMRYNTELGYHASGTAKMGSANDPSAVIDPELRVRGIAGLRVIDASIMPNVTTGDTNTPTIMIGEKGSDLIKNTWNKRRN